MSGFNELIGKGKGDMKRRLGLNDDEEWDADEFDQEGQSIKG